MSDGKAIDPFISVLKAKVSQHCISVDVIPGDWSF